MDQENLQEHQSSHLQAPNTISEYLTATACNLLSNHAHQITKKFAKDEMSVLGYVLPKLLLLTAIICANGFSLRSTTRSSNCRQQLLSIKQSYLDELNLFKAADKKVLVGFTTDAWNIGQRKYKDFLAVHKMTKKIQKQNIACVEVPMWYVRHQTDHVCQTTSQIPSFLLYSFNNLQGNQSRSSL